MYIYSTLLCNYFTKITYTFLIMDATIKSVGFNCNGCSIEPICPPVDFVSDHLLFVKSDGNHVCSHRFSFGHGYFCNCPDRIEYYRKFHK